MAPAQSKMARPIETQINMFKTMQFSKYTIPELKVVAKQLNLKCSGKKAEIIDRIENNLLRQRQCIKIQKLFRGFIVRSWIRHKTCGNYFKPIESVNDCDFYTLDPLNKITFIDIIYVKTTNTFIHGFHYESLKELIKSSSNHIVKNPYDREIMNYTFLSGLLKKHKIICKLPDDLPPEPSKTIAERIRISQTPNLVPALPRDNQINYEYRFRELFAKIDSLGFYTNASWVLVLSQNQCYEFVAHLLNIWNRISAELKTNICPRVSAFSVLNLGLTAFDNTIERDDAMAVLLRVGETMVYDSSSTDYKYLGASYFLSGLVMVSNEARLAIPWLYDNFHAIGRF